MGYPLLSPKNDYVFQKLFTENRIALAGFLSDVLELPVEELHDIEIIDPNLRPESIGDKHCILDVRLRVKGKEIDIEIQLKQQQFIWKRIQYYAARMLAGQAKSGGKYEALPQVISILIADFVAIRQNEAYHHCFRLHDVLNNIPFPDSMEIHVLEIPKARENDGTELGNWMRFFAAREEEEFAMAAQNNPAIDAAWGTIKVLSGDERERWIAESRAKGLMDWESTMDVSRREGREEKGLEIAGKLLQKSMPFSDIAEITGLSLEDIKRLASERQ